MPCKTLFILEFPEDMMRSWDDEIRLLSSLWVPIDYADWQAQFELSVGDVAGQEVALALGIRRKIQAFNWNDNNNNNLRQTFNGGRSWLGTCHTVLFRNNVGSKRGQTSVIFQHVWKRINNWQLEGCSSAFLVLTEFRFFYLSRWFYISRFYISRFWFIFHFKVPRKNSAR
jgi:hypothetical protein